MGMLSKNQTIFEDSLAIRRNKNKILCFDEETARSYIGTYKDINLGYFTKKIKSSDMTFYAKSTAVITGTFSKKNFLSFSGGKFQEYRETVNNLDKKIIISKHMINPTDVLDVVKEWDELAGKRKYGWQLHSGYDKNFFSSLYFEKEKDKLQTLFFYNADTMKCVGYSVLSTECDEKSLEYPIFSYLIRKYIPSKEYKNLCLYIDLKTIQCLVSSFEKEFLVHWGASSGGVLNYKINKFKNFIYKSYDVWFGKIAAS
jgi:hypothetical protein